MEDLGVKELGSTIFLNCNSYFGTVILSAAKNPQGAQAGKQCPTFLPVAGPESRQEQGKEKAQGFFAALRMTNLK